MSSLRPQGPGEFNLTEYDPLNPIWSSRVQAASDLIGEVQGAVDANVMLRNTPGQVAVSDAQNAIAMRVATLQNAAKQLIEPAVTAVQSDINAKTAQAFGVMAGINDATLSPEAVGAAITGIPVYAGGGGFSIGEGPVNIGVPPASGSQGVDVWNWIPPNVWTGVDHQGRTVTATAQPGGGHFYEFGPFPTTPPPQPTTPPPTSPYPPPDGPGTDPDCDWQQILKLTGQNILWKQGDCIYLPIGCAGPPGYQSDKLHPTWMNWGPPLKPQNVNIWCGEGPFPTAPPPATPTDPLACICKILEQMLKPEPECPKWTLWSGLECYIQDAKLPPRRTDDKQLKTGTPETSWISAALQACKPQPDQPDKPPEAPQPHSLASCHGIPAGAVFPATSIVDLINQALGLAPGQQPPAPSGILAWIFNRFGLSSDLWQASERAVIRTVFGWLDVLFKATVCGGPESVPINVTLALVKLLDKWVTDLPPATFRPLEQQRNYLCPTELPSVAQAHQAYLAGEINSEVWACWVRSAGAVDTEQKAIVAAQRSKLSAIELNALFHREIIDGQQYVDRIRQLGFTDPAIPGEVNALTQQIPTLQDLLRFMVRDVGDEALVAKVGMDDQFQQKWTGPLAKFAQNQNIHPDYAKYAWRAHWDLPSPTQLYEMFHRLRHDWIPADQRVTLEDVQNTLVQDDKLPFWVPKYLAISFNPLGRIDVRRAYKIGVLDSEGMRRKYLELGYSDADADTLTVFTQKLTREEWANSPIARQMATYKLTRAEGMQRLQSQGATGEDISEVNRRVDLARDTARRLACQNALKKRYFKYEFDTVELRSDLLMNGAELDEAAMLSQAWECERRARGKILPAGTVCRLYERGLITLTQLYTRFRAIGYSEQDASMMVQDCAIRVGEKIDAKNKRDMQRAQAIAERNQAKLLRLQKEADRQNAKLAKQIEDEIAKGLRDKQRLEKLSADKQKLELQRRKQIMAAAQMVAERGGEDLDEVYHGMRTTIYTSVPTYYFHLTYATDAGTVAAKDPTVDSLAAWQERWESLATDTAPPTLDDLPPTLAESVAQSSP